MTLAKLLDGALDERVLIFGSLPPVARDLDVLARPREAAALAAFLAEQGFIAHHGAWVHFHDCTVDALDLVSTEEFGADAEATQTAFAAAVPLQGFECLARPAPWHVLLLIARHNESSGGELSAKRRARIDSVLAEEGDAWSLAATRAEEWQAQTALAALRALWAEKPSPQRRRQASRPHVVALSGVDGAGKTTQVDALKLSLERLGIETEEEYVRLEWTTLTQNPLLNVVATPVKALVRLGRRLAHGVPGSTTGEDDSARSIRKRNPVIRNGWVLVIALAHAWAQRKVGRPRRADVVICTRYTLDAIVALRFGYVADRPLRLAAGLLRKLSPRPLRAYYLNVDAEVAFARRAEQFGLPELERLTALYRQECEANNVVSLDGTAPRKALCETIALDVWSAVVGR